MAYVFIQGKKIPKPAFVGKQIQTLGIGTFTNIATVQQTATLYDALSIFVDRRVSALPVVNEKGATGYIYNLSDLYLKNVYIEYTFLILSIGQMSAVLAYHSEKKSKFNLNSDFAK